ncbi:hypothetical protein PENTCL1PPCAC_14564, partial [Pristionchus entomophagus]
FAVLPLVAVVHSAILDGEAGPIIRTGKYRVLREKIIGAENYATTQFDDRPFVQGDGALMGGNGQPFTYNGPLDGRRVFIYRRTHTPVRYAVDGIERTGHRQTIERWAEGGYKESQGQNANVYYRVGNQFQADSIVPVKESATNEVSPSSTD